MTDLPTNFADYPQSVTEFRSDKTRLASDNTPRDTLIEALRGIDSGKLNVKHIVIALLLEDEDGGVSTQYRAAGPNAAEAIGLLSLIQLDIAQAR